jgi:two-component system aerobic respiration control protein ArcA
MARESRALLLSDQRRSFDTKDLVDHIERITKERMAQEDVVSLSAFRAKQPKDVPYHLLLIEDDETVRKAMRKIFESDGYRVIAASDGSQLSEVLGDHPIDLIILDIGLPWINGYELALLMKSHVDLKRIPLIFVSARTAQDDMKKAFKVGADDYIKKPFEIEKIKKAVKTLITLAHE